MDAHYITRNAIYTTDFSLLNYVFCKSLSILKQKFIES